MSQEHPKLNFAIPAEAASNISIPVQRPGDPPAGIASAYAQFVRQYDWDYMLTLTFARAPSQQRAASALKALLKRINRKTFGCRYQKRGQGVRWVCATERQACGRIHFHMLVHGCAPKVTADMIAQEWKRIAGDPLVKPYSRKLAASSYITKSAAFDGDLDFGGVWPGLMHGTPVV